MSTPTEHPAVVSRDNTQDAVLGQEAHPDEEGSNTLLIAIACGTILVIAVIGIICFTKRDAIVNAFNTARTRLSIRSTRQKLASADNSPVESSAGAWSVPPPRAELPPQASGGLPRSESQNWPQHDYRKELVSREGGMDDKEVDRGLGLRDTSASARKKYTLLQEEPSNASRAVGKQTRAQSAVPLQARQQQTHRTPAPPHAADLNRPLPDSPSISSMPSPITPATTTETPTSPNSPPSLPHMPHSNLSQTAQARIMKRQSQSAFTPPSVSSYRPYPPTSLPRVKEEARPKHLYPLGATSSSASNRQLSHSDTGNDANTTTSKTAQNTPATANTNTTTSPHPFRDPPPSLPQPYSTVSLDLGSTANLYRHAPNGTSPIGELSSTNYIYDRLESTHDLYRGLSARPVGGRGVCERPWDYLSAEDARGGGWRNSDKRPERSIGSSTFSAAKAAEISSQRFSRRRSRDVGKAEVPGPQKRPSERPPWNFLSAEEARGGGWRNDGPEERVGDRESGGDWETVGEREGEGEGVEETDWQTVADTEGEISPERRMK